MKLKTFIIGLIAGVLLLGNGAASLAVAGDSDGLQGLRPNIWGEGGGGRTDNGTGGMPTTGIKAQVPTSLEQNALTEFDTASGVLRVFVNLMHNAWVIWIR